MTLVVDASVAFRWVFKTDATSAARAVLGGGHVLIAPDLIVPEIANAAWKLVRFDAFHTIEAGHRLGEAVRLLDEIVPCAPLKDRALAIALDLGHPVYDCFYLALSETRGCRLASLDGRLARRCGGTPYEALLAPVP
ncbi:type II toxin-antitoxin system VapC family toxin [Rhodoplanes serenus]|uniref:type II toxin-antitoxin system VapC family toxin n=1 Tax=Rhodoplanes serenus TaxID=200615 RepID=UPI00131B7334|nr:type II toxin-antitoxin system VapC family toxin [Rhodoplanes serenus]